MMANRLPAYLERYLLSVACLGLWTSCSLGGESKSDKVGRYSRLINHDTQADMEYKLQEDQAKEGQWLCEEALGAREARIRG